MAINSLPVDWYFVGTKESQLEGQLRGKTWMYFKTNFGYSYGFHPDYCYYSDGEASKKEHIRKSFPEISYEDFVKYVINKEPFNFNYSYLLSTLKKYNIT